MLQRAGLSTLLSIAIVLFSGCGDSTPRSAPQDKPTVPAEDSGPIAKPTPPFDLPPPPAPDKMQEEHDLSKVDADELESAAGEFANEKVYDLAAKFQHWAYINGKTGRYNLACYYAMIRNKEAAYFFLQECAGEEGMDVDWALDDPDLKSVRLDKRWPLLLAYMRLCVRYWKASGVVQIPVIVPKGYKPGTPIPVAVGLHGLGGDANGFVNDHYQALADELGIALVGVSGTFPNGPNSFSWSEDGAKDAAHILEALERVRPAVRVKEGAIALFGFSQGGQMSVEIAAIDPEHFRGAIALSPGSKARLQTTRLPMLPGNKTQRFIFIAGAGEHPDTLHTARLGDEWAKHAGAKSNLQIYEGMDTHTFPPDFNERIGPWLREILDLPAKK